MTTYLGIHSLEGEPLLVLDQDRDTDWPFLVSSLDLGSIDVRDDVEDDPAGDGTIDNTSVTGASMVTLECTVQGTADRGPYSWLDELLGLCLPAERVFLYVQLDEWPAPRRIKVRGAGVPRLVTELQPDVQLQWKAPEGYLEDADPSHVIVRPSGATVRGLHAPVKVNVSTPPANTAESTLVLVQGNVRPWWYADVYGPGVAPVLSFPGAGWQVAFNSQLALPAGHFVRVYPKSPSGPVVLYDGDPLQDAYGYLDFTRTTWRRLAKGRNSVALTAQSFGGGFHADLYWHNRWH